MNILKRLAPYLEGMSHLTLWPMGPSPRVQAILEQTDAEAIASDWAAVGRDMWTAIELWEQEHPGATLKMGRWPPAE